MNLSEAANKAISTTTMAAKGAVRSIKGTEPDPRYIHSHTGVSPSVRNAVAHLTPPFAVLDLDAFRANAQDLTERAAGKPIRVASKSLRIRHAISTALDCDGFVGVLAYSVTEAIWLVETGVSNDVLVAYPTVNREALRTIAQDPTLRTSITLTVDSLDHIELLDHAVEGDAEASLRVCIDVDASLLIGRNMYVPGLMDGDTEMLWNQDSNQSGANIRFGPLRSPLHGAKDVQRITRAMWSRNNLIVVGILAYEGQIAGVGDAGSSPRQAAVRMLQTLSAGEIRSRRGAIVDAVNYWLLSAGRPPLEFVNGGGTGSMETTSQESAVTEIGAGSGLIGSGLFDGYRQFTPRPAEWFVVPVVRRPGPGVVTVAGGGRIASGVPGSDRLPTIDFPRGLEYTRLEGAGEVQTPLKGDAADVLSIGDQVWLRHAKAGEAMEWVNEVVVVSGGKIVDTWATYRGEGQVFL